MVQNNEWLVFPTLGLVVYVTPKLHFLTAVLFIYIVLTSELKVGHGSPETFSSFLYPLFDRFQLQVPGLTGRDLSTLQMSIWGQADKL